MNVKSLTPQQLGRRVKKLRLERGMSQEDLAKPDYTAAYISHIEHGNRRASQEVLGHIAARLGLTLEQLRSGRDPNEDLRLEVEIQQSVALIHAGNPDQAEERLRPVIARAEEIGHPRAVLRGRESLGMALYRQGELEPALGELEGALRAGEEFPLDERTTAVTGKARCLFQLGEVAGAIHVLESHLVALRVSGSPDPTSLVATLAASIPPYFEAGMIERAKEAASEGWRLSESASDLEQRACLYVNRAQLLLTQQDVRGALASLSLAEDVYRQLDWQADLVKVNLARALVLTDQGSLDEAQQVLVETLEASDGLSATDRGQALSHLARVHRLLGDNDKALDEARSAVAEASELQPIVRGEAHRELGLCLAEAGEVEGALAQWKAALESFETARHHEETARTARLIADRLVERGEMQAAVAYFHKGLGSVEEI